MRRLVFLTQSVDPAHPVLAATIPKIRALAERVDEVVVLAQSGDGGGLPANVEVRTFGAPSRVQRVWRFERELARARAARIDQTGEFPREIFREAGKLGLAGVSVPVEHGGSGMDVVSYAIVIEELRLDRPRSDFEFRRDGRARSSLSPATCRSCRGGGSRFWSDPVRFSMRILSTSAWRRRSCCGRLIFMRILREGF